MREREWNDDQNQNHTFSRRTSKIQFSNFAFVIFVFSSVLYVVFSVLSAEDGRWQRLPGGFPVYKVLVVIYVFFLRVAYGAAFRRNSICVRSDGDGCPACRRAKCVVR